MAITFENVIYDRVIDALHSLIVNEFSIQVYFDEHQSNQSFVLIPGEDALLERLSGGQNRGYSVEPINGMMEILRLSNIQGMKTVQNY